MRFPSIQLEIELKERSITTIRYHNLEWFKQIYVDEKIQPRDMQKPEPFIVGRCYSFFYPNPKYAEELDFYTTFPISIFMGYKNDSVGNPMMLNLHFIPPKIRAAVLDKIFEINMNDIDRIESVIVKNNVSVRNIKTGYSDLMRYLNTSGFQFAIRSYIPTLIATEPKIISHADLWRVLTYANQFMQKKDVREVYRLYKNKLEGYKTFKKEPTLKL